jgi:hypothetical protein
MAVIWGPLPQLICSHEDVPNRVLDQDDLKIVAVRGYDAALVDSEPSLRSRSPRSSVGAARGAGAWIRHKNWSAGEGPSNAMVTIWRTDSCLHRSQLGGSN